MVSKHWELIEKNMGKTLFTFLIILTIISCVKNSNHDIAEVENGLLTGIAGANDILTGYNINERMKLYNVPAVSISVVDDGNIVWSKAYGKTHEGGSETSTQTLFQTGSVGKIIAAITILSLVKDGVVDLDTDINDYLTSWELPQNRYNSRDMVTIRQLLSHTSGIGDDYSEYSLDDSLPSLTEHLEKNNYSLLKPPGEGYFYSGAGYIVIEQIIEDVTGRSYSEVATERVIDRIGLKNTSFRKKLSEDELGKIAFAHHKDGSVYDDPYPVYPSFAPGTCNWSTAEDLAKLFVELRKSYFGESDRLLPQYLCKLMMTHSSPAYGLGMKLIEDNGELFIGHSGDFYGFHACLYGYLESGKGISVTTNGDNGVRLYNEIIRSVSNRYNWTGCKQEILSPLKSRPTITGRYCGSFFLPGKLDVVNIRLVDTQLYADILGYTGSELQPLSDTKFYSAEADAFVIFKEASEGEYDSIEVRKIGVLLPGERIPGFDLIVNPLTFNEGKQILADNTIIYSGKDQYQFAFVWAVYYLIDQGQFEMAAEVAKLGLSVFPGSVYPNISLGEVYYYNNEYQKALDCFLEAEKYDRYNQYNNNMINMVRLQIQDMPVIR